MPIDTGLWANALRPPKSVADNDQENAAAQMNALQAATGRLQYQNALQGQQDAASEKAAYQSFGNDRAANTTKLYQAGLGKQALAYEKATLDATKTQGDIAHVSAQTAGEQIKTRAATVELNARNLVSVTNPDQAGKWYDDAVKRGDIPAEQAAALKAQIPMEPGAFSQWKMAELAKGVSLHDKLQNDTQMRGQDLTRQSSLEGHQVSMRGQDMTAKTAAAGQAVTMRGQNMVDARSKESTAALVTKPFEVTGPDGTPMLVQQDKQSGKLTPVEGFGPKTGSSKPLTDTQAKALGFGTRMQVADQILSKLEGKYSPAAINAKNMAGKVPGLGMIGNAMLSDESQQAEQAQRDFVNAVLRRESGAAISESEFENARQQYFPQTNDKPGNLAQKAANRKLAMEGVLAEVPKGQRNTIGPGKGPAVGSVEGGHKFKGGDPADPKNWEKV